MPNESENRLLDLVAEAITIEPSALDHWLDENCGEASELRAEIVSLLGFEKEAEVLLQLNGEGEQTYHQGASSTFEKDVWVEAPQAGDQLGDYHIERKIGAGGMGIVYAAKQLSLNRSVALKVLPANLRNSRNALVRFQREIEAAARLRHDNVVSVHATGDDGGTSYYAMELIDGPSLSEVLTSLRLDPIPELQINSPWRHTRQMEANEPLTRPAWLSCLLTAESVSSDSSQLSKSPELVRPGGNYFEVIANLLAEVADGLEYAHNNQIIHRDIKPSNLLLSADGRIHISDFGLARILAEPSVTHSGDFVGTPFYMAPEQISPKIGQIDGRTDIYGLGATLYELLTLRPPFPGASRDEVLAKITTEEAAPPRRLNTLVPRDLETICLQALEKDPTQRYQSAAQMADDLRRFASHWPISAKRNGIVVRTWKWYRRHRAMAASLLIAGGLGLTATAMAYNAHESSQGKALAEQQRDSVVSRVNKIEQDLKSAQEKVIRAQQTEQERVFEQALLAAMQGDQRAVQQALNFAIEQGAPPGRLHILRGQIAMFSASFEEAIIELEAAIKLMPDELAPHALLAESFARSGLWEQSKTVRGKLSKMEPASIEDLILLGRMQSYYSSKTAEATLKEAISRDKQNIAARLIRGGIRTQRAYSLCSIELAELALEDLNLATSLLPETSYVLSKLLHARLIAAAAYQAAGDTKTEQIQLSAAGKIAEKLATFPGDYEAHRWRAFYFDRIGALDQAIEDWQAIDEKTVGFLVMTLYRAGRFEEALEACDRYAANSDTGTAEFCHSFVLAAMCDTPEELTEDFQLTLLLPRDRSSAWRAAYTLWCLAGLPERAQEEVRKIGLGNESGWQRKFRYQYFCGDISGEEYLERVTPSRFERAWGNFVVGMERLSRGDRKAAKQHFEISVSHQFTYSFFDAMSRALLDQLDRDPNWPAWTSKARGK